MQVELPAAEEIIGAWAIGPATLAPISSGHINGTFRVEAAGHSLILQRVSPIFAPEVHLDIEAVTAHLEAAGLPTPRLVPAGDRLWVTDPQGGVWRMMTCMPGINLQRADSPARCRSAGALLGRFHRVLWDYDRPFGFSRVGVHDTARHLARLRAALTVHHAHRASSQVRPVAEEILQADPAAVLPADLPRRVVHGDPKISNIIFEPGGEASCLIDLDTLARMPLALELGDALRSWCSPLGEDVEGPFELDFFRAALEGYAGAIGGLPLAREREAIPRGVLCVALELAARFCTDALEESYFGWNRRAYASSSEHNLARARSQVHLARQVRARLPELDEVVKELWAEESP